MSRQRSAWRPSCGLVYTITFPRDSKRSNSITIGSSVRAEALPLGLFARAASQRGASRSAAPARSSSFRPPSSSTILFRAERRTSLLPRTVSSRSASSRTKPTPSARQTFSTRCANLSHSSSQLLIFPMCRQGPSTKFLLTRRCRSPARRGSARHREGRSTATPSRRRTRRPRVARS